MQSGHVLVYNEWGYTTNTKTYLMTLGVYLNIDRSTAVILLLVFSFEALWLLAMGLFHVLSVCCLIVVFKETCQAL